MALSVGPDITGLILEYSTYHYNYHTLQQLITYNNTVQATNWHIQSWEIPGKVLKTQWLNCLHYNTHHAIRLLQELKVAACNLYRTTQHENMHNL